MERYRARNNPDFELSPKDLDTNIIHTATLHSEIATRSSTCTYLGEHAILYRARMHDWEIRWLSGVVRPDFARDIS